MKRSLYSCITAVALMCNAVFVSAANELVVYTANEGKAAEGMTIKLDADVEKTIDRNGLVFFNLEAGTHNIEIFSKGELVHSFRFDSEQQQLMDVAVSMSKGKNPVVSVKPYLRNETSADKAATGSVQGVVTANGMPVIGATVRIDSLNIEEETDERGVYQLTAPQGVYQLSIDHPDLGSKTADNYRIIANVVKGSNFAIRQSQAIEEVTVVAKFKASDLEASERYSVNVVNTMDVEQMERFGDSNAAIALSRIVGVTVTDGKFANVRGLDGRYVSSTINGLMMPSTDPLRRDVQLDLFPSNILGGIEIQKSYSANLLGSTTGGIVKMVTRGLPDEEINKVSVSGGYNFEFTGDDIVSYEGSNGDWIGYDSGLRELPGHVLGATKGGRSLNICDVSIDPERCTDPLVAAALGVQFQDDYNIKKKSAKPEFSASLAHGNRLELLDGEVGYYGTLGYKSSTKNRVDAKKDDPFGLVGAYERSLESVNVNGYLVAGYEFAGGDEINSKTIYLHDADNKTSREEGVDDDTEIKKVVLEWVERDFIAQHFSGTHFFPLGEEDHQLDWRVGYSLTERYEPDRRTYTYLDGNFSTSAFERRWSELDESSFDAVVDYKIPFKFNGDIFAEIKMGALLTDKSREFELYRFSVNPGDNSDEVSFSDTENLEEVLSYQNFILDRVRLATTTTPTDSYDADEEIAAIYLNSDVEFGERASLSAGVRHEDFTQELTYPNGSASDNAGPLENEELLPAMAFTYRVTDRFQIRAGYSNTISYPGIIERSRSSFFDPETDRKVIGNPDLEVSNIDNYDLRFEFYANEEESISLAYFFKDIDKPVERVLADGSGEAAKAETFRHAKSAELTGIELDFRKNLFDRAGILAFVSGNISYIESEVDLDDVSLKLEGEDSIGRTLQGQSPWLANLQFGLDDEDSEQKLTLLVNYFDDRIDLITRGANTDHKYEVGRVLVDLNYERTFNETMKFKAKLKNILNEDVSWEQNGNEIETYKEGTSLTLSFSYEF